MGWGQAAAQLACWLSQGPQHTTSTQRHTTATAAPSGSTSGSTLTSVGQGQAAAQHIRAAIGRAVPDAAGVLILAGGLFGEVEKRQQALSLKREAASAQLLLGQDKRAVQVLVKASGRDGCISVAASGGRSVATAWLASLR